MNWLISGKLLYNFALCYLASGNLWLSFWVERGIQVTGGRDGKCVIYHKCNRNNLVYFWVPVFNSTFFRCVTKRFSQDGQGTRRSIQRLFSQCVGARGAPILAVCFPDSDKWAYDWIHQQHGIWMKDDEVEGVKWRSGSPVSEGLGCWTSEDGDADKDRKMSLILP